MAKANTRYRPLVFVIHDLNPWGGHERSTLEIARRLSHRWPVEVYAYSLTDPKMADWGQVRFHPILPNVRRPIAAKITYFYGATLFPLGLRSKVGGGAAPLIHATGTCCLASDVVQVQFVSKAWKEKQKALPEDVCTKPFARGENGPGAWARKLYYDTLLDYNIAVENQVYRPEKTYIAIANCVAEELRDYFGLTRNIHVIHHGVDSDQFAPAQGAQVQEREELRRSLGIAPDELAMLLVGTYERKGLAVAIDSLAKLSPQARSKVKLVAVGGGAEEGFRARARALGVEDRVIFVGHTQNVPAYYRAGDLFLLPTLYEPFGLVILEAMACGLAPVVSKLAGGAELIDDGRSGFLIQDPTHAGEIAGYVEKLVLDEALRKDMAKQARAVAVARSWDRVADEYAAVLEPMLALEAKGGADVRS